MGRKKGIRLKIRKTSLEKGKARGPDGKRMQEDFGQRSVPGRDEGMNKGGPTKNRFFKFLKKSIVRIID